MSEFITRQTKLSRDEWSSIEVPCSNDEKRILSLIVDGYNNVNVSRNYTSSLACHMKMTDPAKFDSYIYTHYFEEYMKYLSGKYRFSLVHGDTSSLNSKREKPIVLKKADMIRMENTTKNIEEYKNSIFEYILIDLLEKLLQYQVEEIENKRKNKIKKSETNKKAWMYYLYTLYKYVYHHTYVDIYTHICIYMYICTYKYIYIYICMYIYLIYMYFCTYTHKYIPTLVYTHRSATPRVTPSQADSVVARLSCGRPAPAKR